MADNFQALDVYSTGNFVHSMSHILRLLQVVYNSDWSFCLNESIRM